MKGSNNLNLYPRKLEKEEHSKPKASRSQEIINIRVKSNEIEIKTIEKISETEI